MGIPHTFVVRVSDAQQVNVIGEFNNWQTTATSMERVGEDLWRVTVDLEPGQYRYAYFVINNRWHDAAGGILGRTRIIGQGSWAHVTPDNWAAEPRHVQLPITHDKLSAA